MVNEATEVGVILTTDLVQLVTAQVANALEVTDKNINGLGRVIKELLSATMDKEEAILAGVLACHKLDPQDATQLGCRAILITRHSHISVTRASYHFGHCSIRWLNRFEHSQCP